MKHTFITAILFSVTLFAQAQSLLRKEDKFTRKDTLRGALTPLRTCYDVVYYNLYVDVNPTTKALVGNNGITAKAVSAFDRLQLDLSDLLTIDSIIYNNKSLKFTREFNTVYVNFDSQIKQGDLFSLKVYYHGNPLIAAKPPWDGGLVFSKDEEGNPWLSVSCEGIGASIWWPCKDHLSDEPDSMRISGPAPAGLTFVANGRLVNTYKTKDGREVNEWLVKNPINNYNATYYIGKYTHFTDTYTSKALGKKLVLDYYVMPYNLSKAKKQFAEVKPMMEAFEKYFGPYPFWEDSYKLVEASYLGMEHQSAIAYGNHYRNGYDGMDFSGYGLKYDFVVIHESGHEWWGNHVTMADLADMWISEGFCTYAEVVYVEHRYGKESAQKYINFKRDMVENDFPIIGEYGVNNEGSGDMYAKGALMIHTLRGVINNDKVFFDILMGIQKDLSFKPVSTADIVKYFNDKTGKDLTVIFDQYLRHVNIPILEYTIDFAKTKSTIKFRWKSDVKDFTMPVDILVNGVKQRVNPTTEWQSIEVLDDEPIKFMPDYDHFYIKAQQVY